MRKTLLLLCVCLFGAVSGAKEWTSVTPQVGKSYYLLNTTYNQFWYASGTALGDNRYYGVTDNIAAATPIYVETAGDGYNWTFSFYIGGVKWFINQNDGKTYLYPEGSKFQLWADGDGKYYLRTQEHTSWGKTYRHYLHAESSLGTCNFPDSKDHYCEWNFIAAEEAMSSMANHCATVAEANYVSGWERVTSVDMLKTNPENYFYAILSTNAAGLMVRTNTDDGQGYYINGANPLSNSAYLFGIENYSYNSEDYFVMKAQNTNAYYYPLWDHAYELYAPSSDKTTADDACRLTFNYVDNAWSIKTWAVWDEGSNWGLWFYNSSEDGYKGYKDGAKMAGNKTNAQKGSFLIYRIAKANLDMTSRIANPSFETDEDGHVGATGWTLEDTKNDTKVHLNSDPTYTMTSVDGEKLFNTWDGDSRGYTISQTISNLPAGVYKVTAVMGAFADQTLQLIANDVTGEAPSVDKGTGVLVTTYVTLASPGDLTIQAKTKANGFYKVDDFHLTYLGGASANLKVNDGKLGTFIAPFDITLPDNVKAYSATSDKDKVTLTKIKEGGETLSAGTPVIIYGDGVSVNTTFYGNSTVSENQTVGALTGILKDSDKTISSGKYVLQTQTGTQAFYKLDAAAPGALNRCYVSANSVGASARLVISYEDDDPMAINAIEAADAKAEGLKDGKYFIGNRIVIVKNKVKYGANGQILK